MSQALGCIPKIYSVVVVLYISLSVVRSHVIFSQWAVCLWEEEKKERVLGNEMAFVRGHMHQCLNTCACLA